jgi:hypothetical protein
MKTLSTGSLLLVSGLLFVSCSKKDKIAPALSADKTTVNATAQAGMEYLQISSNTDWTISGMPSWLTITPASGNGDTRVEFSFTANTGSNDRTANLSLSSTGGTAATPVAIVISQLQAPVVITSFTEHAKGGATITITGSGFSGVLAENMVKINDKPATLTAATLTSLSVTVPAKAGDGKIAVTVGTKTTTTTKNFYYDWIAVVTTVAGNGGEFSIGYPADVARDAAGNLYISNTYSNSIQKVSPDGTITTVAGGGKGFADGNGVNARFFYPSGIALDGNGNLFVADMQNHAIRKVSPGGVVTTIAGNGAPGAVNGNGTAASFNNPAGIAVDANGNVFVSDQFNHMIRKISPNGNVTTFAGGTTRGAADGIGSAASFSMPYGMTFDANGNLHVADWYNHSIRKITPNAQVTTIAGKGVGWVDGLVAVAKFNYLAGVAIDTEGNMYVADRDNYRIRKISAAGWVSTLAGSEGALPYFQDGTGSDAHFFLPLGVTVDGNGTVYVADQSNSRIRKLIQQ